MLGGGGVGIPPCRGGSWERVDGAATFHLQEMTGIGGDIILVR